VKLKTALAVAPLLALALVACSEEENLTSNVVFDGPAWTGAEKLTYDLLRKDGKLIGTCVLETQPDKPRPGQTTLRRNCTDADGNRDDAEAVVNSATLSPAGSQRTIFLADDTRETAHTIAYGSEEAHFTTSTGGKTREADRELPEPDDKSPNPAWYDDDSVFWLARGIPLRENFDSSYTHVINAGLPRLLPVRVLVEGQETVKTPAGEFRAWKIRLGREDSIYRIWVDVAAPHRVVQSRIESVEYQLRRVE